MSTSPERWAARVAPQEELAVFLAVGLPGLALAAYLAFVAHIYMGDAVSRTYQAATVLYLGGLHLANLSFIWTPLPSLVQVPLLALRPLAANAFASQITSVAFAAGTLVVLNRLLARLAPARGWRYALLAAYQLNPLVLLYTVNGMTESMLMFWVVLGVDALSEMWWDPQGTHLGRVARMAIAAAAAFLTRYEGVSFGLVLGLGLLTFTARYTQPPRRFPERAEGYLLAFWAPWAYAIFLWVYANWIIMGNPLYFLTGRGSNRDQAAALLGSNQELAGLVHNLPGALAYVGNVLVHVYPAFFLVIGWLLVHAWRRHDWYAAALALVAASFPAFQVALHLTGQSFGYARFHLYVVPLTLLGAVYLMSRMRAGVVWQASVLGVLIVSSATIVLAPLRTDAQAWDGELNYFGVLTGRLPSPRPLEAQREAGEHLRDLIRQEPQARILADDLTADAVIVFADAYERVISSRDERFARAMARPFGTVDYLLVSSSSTDLITPVATRLRAEGYPGEVVYITPTDSNGVRWSLYRLSSN